MHSAVAAVKVEGNYHTIAAASIALNIMATDGPSSAIMSSGGGSAVEPKEETHHLDNHVELERLKKECSGMINTLKALHDEEQRLREGNHILAQQAVIMVCLLLWLYGTATAARHYY